MPLAIIRSFKLLFITFLVALGTNIHAAPSVLIETSQGNITVELYPEKAPKTVANFLKYVEDDFYSNTIFHRVINNFMIQGGGFEKDLTEKNTRAPIPNEAANGLLNETGTIAMARTSDPDSATAQFFINLTNNQFLNYTSPDPELIGYCVFGKVTAGLDVVKKIGLMPTGSMRGFSDVPVKPIIIRSVKVIKDTVK
jgi:cyclophilin family peptidyl-prolyl cis-trans isomerase